MLLQNSLNSTCAWIAAIYSYLLYWMYFTTEADSWIWWRCKAYLCHLTNEKRSFPLVAHPKDEQSAIATFLDRETAKIDALIAKQEQLITLLQEKRQALISHVVTKGLNPNAPMKDSGIGVVGRSASALGGQNIRIVP